MDNTKSKIVERLKSALPEVLALAHQINQTLRHDFHHLEGIQIFQKADGSQVSESDLKAHTKIATTLALLFDNEIPVISEEDPAHDHTYDTFFLIDPLDGTADFLKNRTGFCVNIALIDHGKVVFGLIAEPIQQRVFYAFCGEGAFVQERVGTLTSLPTQDPSNLDKIFSTNSCDIIACLKAWVKESKRSQVTCLLGSFGGRKAIQILQSLPAEHQITRLGSALKFPYLATGHGDFYPRPIISWSWDIAAGALIAGECGARMIAFKDLTVMDSTLFLDRYPPFFLLRP